MVAVRVISKKRARIERLILTAFAGGYDFILLRCALASFSDRDVFAGMDQSSNHHVKLDVSFQAPSSDADCSQTRMFLHPLKL
jgi:hypothetical protein